MKLYPHQVSDNAEESLELCFYSYQMSPALFGALHVGTLNYNSAMVQLYSPVLQKGDFY